MSDLRDLQAGRWLVVARKEVADTVRSRVLWLVSVLFVSIFALPPVLLLYFDIGRKLQAKTGRQLSTNAVLLSNPSLADVAALLVPLVAIFVAYAAVVRERQSGSLKFLLSLPHTRADVVVGKLVGRTAVLVAPITLSLAITAAVLLPTRLTFDAVGFLTFTVLTLVLGAVFVALAVGVSAATSTTRRAMVGSVGVFVYLALFWKSLASGIGRLLSSQLGVSTATRFEVVLFVRLLNPTDAYRSLLYSLLGSPEALARARLLGGFQRLGAMQAIGRDVPLYLSDWMVATVLLAWVVVPLAVGYRVFERADL